MQEKKTEYNFDKGLHLKEVFDICDWNNKHLGKLPDKPSDIRYKWLEDEAEEAKPFFTVGVLHESTAAVDRELFLGEEDGGWILCVTETTSKDFSPRDVAKEMARLMNPDKAKKGFQQIWNMTDKK